MVSKLKGTASPRDSKTCEDGPGVKIEALATCRFESFQRYSKITVNYMYTYIYIIYIYIILYIYIIFIARPVAGLKHGLWGEAVHGKVLENGARGARK
jgi:hypothetical protein